MSKIVTLKGTSYDRIVNMIEPLPGTDEQKKMFVQQYIEAEHAGMLTTGIPSEEYLFWLNEQDA